MRDVINNAAFAVMLALSAGNALGGAYFLLSSPARPAIGVALLGIAIVAFAYAFKLRQS